LRDAAGISPATTAATTCTRRFTPGWQALRDESRAIHAAVGRGRRWGGVELALAVHHALGPAAVRNGLVTAAARLLEGHARPVQQRLETVLASGGIDVRTDFKPA